MVETLKTMLDMASIDYRDVVASSRDVSLAMRVQTANAIYALDKRAMYLSVHGNAGGGSGWEVWTSVGQTRSDRIATVFYTAMQKEFPGMKYRPDMADGDFDKESNFYVLKNTDMPAILTENFFMDTLNPDCELMMSAEGVRRIAKAHFDAIMDIEDGGINY